MKKGKSAKKAKTKPRARVGAVKKATDNKPDLNYKVTEIYVRISKSNGLDKDTFAHGATGAQEAIDFITKHT